MATKYEKIEFEAFLSILTLQPTCIPKISTKNSILTKIIFSVVDSLKIKDLVRISIGKIVKCISVYLESGWKNVYVLVKVKLLRLSI